jgi:hypothetical protein
MCIQNLPQLPQHDRICVPPSSTAAKRFIALHRLKPHGKPNKHSTPKGKPFAKRHPQKNQNHTLEREIKMSNLHLVNPQKQAPNYAIIPNSYCFGADKDLTVITAYLMPNVELHQLVYKQIPAMKNELAVAFVVCQDYEEDITELHCLTERGTEYALDLTPREERYLVGALTQSTLEAYGYTPKEILNRQREMMNLAPL